MRNARNLGGWAGVMLLPLALGCASAYHSYQTCEVNCRYCPEPPLPYTAYPGCVCHSCAAQPYLNAHAESQGALEAPEPR
jgi:hypothetical protein